MRTAAFFDLDKTIIAKSSTLAFGRSFYQGGLINRRAVLKTAYAQFVYLVGGADHDQMERMRQYLSALCTGWDVGQVKEIVTETMHERGMLSSAVLWFERDWDAPGKPFTRPGTWDPEAMASISTHDLPTVSGWLQGEHVRQVPGHHRAQPGQLGRCHAGEPGLLEFDRPAQVVDQPGRRRSGRERPAIGSPARNRGQQGHVGVVG